jgi:hypothetical protein
MDKLNFIILEKIDYSLDNISDFIKTKDKNYIISAVYHLSCILEDLGVEF